MLNKRSVSQNLIALRRHGTLFRNLNPELQEEILFDMEHDMLVGDRHTVITDRNLLHHLHPNARAGAETYGEGQTGKRQKGVTVRRSPPHDHMGDGGHIPLEGSGEKKG